MSAEGVGPPDAGEPAPGPSQLDSGTPDAPAGAPPRSGGHAIRIAGAILLSRLAGLGRELLAASFLGVGAHADVYAVTTRLPNLLQNLLGEQTLSAAFIPFYSRLLGRGDERRASRFAGAILGLLLVAAAVLALVGVLLAGPLVAVFAAGFVGDAALVAAGVLPVDRYELSVSLVRIFFPMAGVLVVSAWALGVLNSHRRFFLPYFAPVLWNLAIIAAMLGVGGLAFDVAPGGDDKTRLLHAIAWGSLVGAVLQLGVQIPGVAKRLPGFRLSLGRKVEGVREAVGAFGPAVAGRGVVQLSSFLDMFLATLAAAGAAAALRYASTLYLLPISLFAMSVAASELPELSRLDGEGDARRLARVTAGLRQMAFLTVPTAVGFVAFGWLIIGAVFQRGAFGLQDQLLVSLVLAGYTLGLLPTTVSRLLQNVFYSLHDTRFPARVAAVRVVTAALMGAGLMIWLDRYGVFQWLGERPGERELKLGAVGLALGSAASGWVELTLLLRGARRRLPDLALPWASFGKLAGLALAAAAPAAALWWALAGRATSLVAAAVVGTFAAAYLGGALALRLPEVQAWVGRLQR